MPDQGSLGPGRLPVPEGDPHRIVGHVVGINGTAIGCGRVTQHGIRVEGHPNTDHLAVNLDMMAAYVDWVASEGGDIRKVIVDTRKNCQRILGTLRIVNKHTSGDGKVVPGSLPLGFGLCPFPA